jgi:uncharacterized protein (TIRG00374 family)
MPAPALAPRLLRRGLEIFAAISVVGFGGLLLYGNNLERFAGAMTSLHLSWLLAAVGLASMDWLGGGLRIYVLARHVYPRQSLKGAILSSGMTTWAGYLTPAQAGSGPMMVYALKRYGTPLPEAMVVALMTFVATVVFFAVAGPVAVFLGAGQSLQAHGVIGDAVNLYDLFRLSLGGFVGIGVAILILILFPGLARRLAAGLAGRFERRGKARWVERLRALEAGVDRAHQAVTRFGSPWGWGALVLSVVLSAAAHANKLLAGFVVLKMLGIDAAFVDVLLLQTLISFLLYFAPTPGGSGLAEILSAAVMSIYLPRALTPSYILLWRLTVSYLTVGAGSVIFWHWLKEADHGGGLLESAEGPISVAGGNGEH